MDLIVYDKQFNPLKLVDTYDSLIWTERLYSPGDFELVVRPSTEAFRLFAEGNYVWNREAKEKYPEYTVLEYIQSSGTQWIDTEWQPNFNDKIRICFQAAVTNASTSVRYIVGSTYAGSTNNFLSLEIEQNAFRVDINAAVDKHIGSFVANQLSECEFIWTPTNQWYGRNNTAELQGTNAFSGQTNANMLIFIDQAKRYSTFNVPLRIGGHYTIEVNDELIRDLIPVKRYDGVVCMYDLVNKRYHNPQGTGAFTAGPEIGSLGPERILRKLMVIEKNELQTDPENGNQLIISGRSLESILDRRIVWNQTEINTTFQAAVQRLLNENVINPSVAARKINNFKFVLSSDPGVTALTLEAQYTGDNLLEVMNTNCEDFKIGYRIELNDDNEFVFQLYKGKDHSYDQTSNPYICFRPEFDNLLNSNYKHDGTEFKNITRIGGEGEGNQRTFAQYYITASEPTGLDRKEIFTDAGSTSSKSYDEAGQQKTLSAAEYQAVLQEKGSEELLKCEEKIEFEAEIETTQQYKFKEDFDLGDRVQIVNEYGIEGVALITEVVRSVDQEGSKTYPAFVIIDED